jgi:hypothetical protein
MEKKKLNSLQIRKIGKNDKAGRWYPIDEVSEYFSHLRAPSRAFPSSYWKSAGTAKFYKWLEANHPDLLKRI